jgi:hypothetical protein
MRTRLRSHVTYANVTATLALFLALSTGGAYAFNEWTGANVVDESLTGADVQGKAQTSSAPAVNGSLTGYDVAGQPAIPALGQPFIDGSLTTWDINDSTLAGRDVQDGSLTSPDILDGTLAARDLANNAVGTSQVANDTLTASDIGANAVGTSEVATGAVRTEELANGQVQAEDLAPGVAPGASGARAWGLVNFNGDLVRSKNITAVTPMGSGRYCIDPGPGIDPITSVMLVGQDYSNDATDPVFDDISHAEWVSGGSDCPATTMQVRTFAGRGNPPSFDPENPASGEKDLGGFDLSDADQGFTFVIP